MFKFNSENVKDKERNYTGFSVCLKEITIHSLFSFVKNFKTRKGWISYCMME